MKGRRAVIVLALLVVLGVGVHAAKKKKNAVTADTTITHKVCKHQCAINQGLRLLPLKDTATLTLHRRSRSGTRRSQQTATPTICLVSVCL